MSLMSSPRRRAALAATGAVLLAGVVVAPLAAASDAGQARIIGGVNATETYPFFVYAQNCGASLIAPNWIVSARHCHSGGNPKDVRIGSTSMTEGGETRTVKRWVLHPKGSDYSNDIMVGELDSPSTLAPIAMADVAPAPGTETRLLGWGSTSPEPPAERPLVLQELNTSILAAESCTKKPGEVGPPSINASTELCTNNPDKKGPCVMDSGGPQITKVNGAWVLVGLTNRSTGGMCGEKPSIYASIAAHRAWIKSVIGM